MERTKFHEHVAQMDRLRDDKKANAVSFSLLLIEQHKSHTSALKPSESAPVFIEKQITHSTCLPFLVAGLASDN